MVAPAVISALWRLQQEDCGQFEANVGNKVRSCFKKIKGRKERKKENWGRKAIAFVALLIRFLASAGSDLEQPFLDVL